MYMKNTILYGQTLETELKNDVYPVSMFTYKYMHDF